jgi:RNA ligase (TIGR02306 family)
MENQNSVCYVAKINEIKTIVGADNIESVIVGGWNAITKKGDYKKGQLIVIATTDAVIPSELSETMGVTSYLRGGSRVRTVKLRGVYSECLIIPTTFLKSTVISEGKDLMKELDIFKYEPPVKQIQLSSGKTIKIRENTKFKVYHKFPNLKNVAGLFTEEDEVEITRKVHGSNFRAGIVKKDKLSFLDKVKKFFRLADKRIDYEFVYGSHNVQKGSDTQGYYSTDVWKDTIDKYSIKEKLWDYFDFNEVGSGIIVYGEVYGKGIQKNYEYGLNEIRFAGFDVIVNGQYTDTEESKHIVIKNMGLPYVDILYRGNWKQEIQDSFVFNNFIEGTKVPHEGVVVKHISGNRNKVAKVINPDYLIFGEKNNVGDGH